MLPASRSICAALEVDHVQHSVCVSSAAGGTSNAMDVGGSIMLVDPRHAFPEVSRA